MIKKTDVIVIGGGHAGVEAAAAAARLGVEVCLITIDASKIGVMSCNPAIGGIGKGHIVRELDALGGIMPIAADKSGIQFKVLNASKGPAVRGPRCQADREIYKKSVQGALKEIKNITIISEIVTSLKIKDNRCSGVELASGESIISNSVVLTTGTFLNGVIYIGNKKLSSGRLNEKSSTELGNYLKGLSLPMTRLKTGTPPRLLKSTINYNVLEEDCGDNNPDFFSSTTNSTYNKQVSCYVTWTNKETHEIIKKSISKSPLYNGAISSRGPRYCPSIEDKVHRFYTRERHRVMLEPEGLKSDLIYPNGISTSLPLEKQTVMINSITGLEKAKIVQPGYAIEYDHIDPRALTNTLESKNINNLFFAGQINGTTGYEEAAGQGLIAGVNAALLLDEKKGNWTLSRTNAYIGVMIDDLIARGAPEPYRMFTSRAEYRLYLRADNADLRLSEKAIKVNLLDNLRKKIFTDYKKEIKKLTEICKKISITPNEANKIGLKLSADGKKRNLLELIGFDNVNEKQILIQYPNIGKFSKRVFTQLKIQSKYDVHVKKQEASIISYKKDSKLKIPKNIDYTKIGGLSKECSDALGFAKPGDLAAAARIPGVTAAALTSVLLYTKKNKVKKVAG
jgi:tRNA uridine 5-carboxymethylaminomethyl modification enzyme